MIAAGLPIDFGITAFDAYGNTPQPAAETSDFAVTAVMSTDTNFLEVSGSVSTSASGFIASVAPEVVGVYEIRVSIGGDVVPHGTITVTVAAAVASAAHSTVEGEGWLVGLTDVPLVAEVVVRDEFSRGPGIDGGVSPTTFYQRISEKLPKFRGISTAF